MPSDDAPIAPGGTPRSVLRGCVIDALTPGALSAVVASQATPSEQEWAEATRRGVMVVRSRIEGSGPAWMNPGRSQWEGRVASLTAEATRRRVQVFLWPHAADVVSDVPGLVAHCRAGGWPILLDPMDLLTQDMLANADDHLTRIREATAIDCVRNQVAAVVVRDADPAWWHGAVVLKSDERREGRHTEANISPGTPQGV